MAQAINIDVKALKAKLNTLKGQNSKTSSIWKPKPGKNTIRIVPWKEDKSNPFIELQFHYLGGKTYLSPTSYGNPDPIAEFADKLRSTGDKEDYKQSKQFKPKPRYYVPVIVRGEENEGVRFYAFGKEAYGALLSIVTDIDEFGDVTSVEQGRDMIIEFTSQEDSDTNFAKTAVRPRANQTPLGENPELIKKWLVEQPDIREIFKEPSYSELENVLEKYLNPEEDSLPGTPASVNQTEEKEDVKEQDPVTTETKSKALDNSTKKKLEALFDED